MSDILLLRLINFGRDQPVRVILNHTTSDETIFDQLNCRIFSDTDSVFENCSYWTICFYRSRFSLDEALQKLTKLNKLNSVNS